MSEYMTVAEVAAHFRVSKMTIYRMVKDGTLPSLTVGRSIRINVEEVKKMKTYDGAL